MKVGFLTADWSNAFENDNGDSTVPGGSAWYRCINPGAQMSLNGFEVVIAQAAAISSEGLILVDGVGVHHDDCDVVVMQRIMNDFGVKLVECARKAGQKVVNDVDDWYWGLHPANQAYLTTDPRTNPKINSRHYRACVEASDLVTVSTPFLAEKIAEWGCEGALVRNAIDLYRWEGPSDFCDDPVTVGWVGSTSHRSGDLETLKGVIGPLVERHDLHWHEAGHIKGFPHAFQLAGVKTPWRKIVPIVPIYEYPNLFEDIDIGLVPLSKHPFNEGKSWLKGLEYAAAGVPFVAQASREYRTLRDEFGIGTVAKRPNQWVRELERLLDPGERKIEAERNWNALQRLDIRLRWVDWAEVYLNL